MANEKGGRILDKDFEAGITDKMSELQHEAQVDINKAQRYAQADINKAQKYVYSKNDEFEEMVSDHPKSFVLGAFIGGLVIGALLSKGSK